MNIHYPIHERENHQMLWLLAAAVILASLVLVSQAAFQPVVVNIGNPANASVSHAIPHPVPVPEPPHSQPALQSRVSSTPIPQGIEQHPVPQPILTPPSGK